MYRVKEKTNISFVKSIRTFIKVVLCTLVMVIVLSILNLFIPNYSVSRFMSIIYIIIYGIVGVIVYIVMAYESNTINEIIGKNYVDSFIKKIKKVFKK